METSIIQILTDPSDGSQHAVTQHVVPGEERYFDKAPPPYDAIAPYWLKPVMPGLPPTYHGWRIAPPSAGDVLLEQFKRLQGDLLKLSLREFINLGGKNYQFRPSRDKWRYDFKLFLGKIDPPDAMAPALDQAQQEFVKYGLGRGELFRMIRYDDDPATEERTVTARALIHIAFPETEMRGSYLAEAKLHYRHEDVGSTLAVVQIVSDCHEAWIRNGRHVPLLHPQTSPELARMNAALA
jgi:hypothetical protein